MVYGNLKESNNDVTSKQYMGFYIGLSLAISSSVFIGTSFILKKKGLLRLSHRAGEGGYGYLKDPMWWSGMILMGVGEFANFAAYAFAPATLVTPLGALSVLVTAILSSKFLNERLNILGKLGCSICVLGSTVLVIHSPKEQDLQSMDELAARLTNPGFMIYTSTIIVLACALIFCVSPRHGQSNPFVYITITGTMGSLTVMGCKGLGVALKQTLTGDNQLTNPLTWFVIISVTTCITVQLNYMNKALDIFNTAVVTPVLYVIFTGCVIMASAILFKEWQSVTAENVVGIMCGFLIIMAGIFLLQGFKDLDISLKNLPKACKDNHTRDVTNYNNEGLKAVNYNTLPRNEVK